MTWYTYMAALEDKQMQKHGLVVIIFALGDAIRQPMDSGIFLKLPKTIAATPVSVRGVHFCYGGGQHTIAHVRPNPITVIQWAFDVLVRTKIRLHFGT